MYDLVQQLGSHHHDDAFTATHAASFVELFRDLGVTVNTTTLARYTSAQRRQNHPPTTLTTASSPRTAPPPLSITPNSLNDVRSADRLDEPLIHFSCASSEAVPPSTTTTERHHQQQLNHECHPYAGTLPSPCHRARLAERYQKRAEKLRADPFAGRSIFAPTRFAERDGFTSVETRSTKRLLVPDRTNGPSLCRPPLQAVGARVEPSPREIITATQRPGGLDRNPLMYRLPPPNRHREEDRAAAGMAQPNHPVKVPAAASSSPRAMSNSAGTAATLPRVQARFEQTFHMLSQPSPRHYTPRSLPKD